MENNTILIVEDNPANLKLVKVLLVKNGYDVHTATNAEETLNILESIHPRLILMDIQLPIMNGLDLTRQLKSDPRYSDIQIVAVTAYAMKSDEEKALAAGCDGYISKPIDVNQFAGTVADFLNK